jgi:mannitol-1-/sugar-/sorbitol-6-phosphatase
MIHAFVFDLDGTLLDSEILWVEAIETFMRERDPTVTRDYATAIVYGRSWRDIYVEICRRIEDIDMSILEMQVALKPYFDRLGRTRDIRIPGSVKLLQSLSRDYPVCIVSGAPRDEIREGVELMGIGDLLDFYLGAEDYSPGKPDPTCFLMAAGKLGIPPAECLVFEDSSAGVLAAKRAGMACVGLAREGRPPQELSAADIVLSDLEGFRPEAWGKQA